MNNAMLKKPVTNLLLSFTSYLVTVIAIKLRAIIILMDSLLISKESNKRIYYFRSKA